MPVAASVRVALELLDIVAAAHAKGIVHRDVKPGNVFLTTSGSVRLLDFGIARATDNANAIATMTGATMGTPAYMPPEQARGLMRDVDARSDLWAVGATLFSMITAAKVREGETNNELLVMAVTEPVRSIVHRAPWIAPALAAVVDKSLSFDKADRFQSAAEMKAALASLPPEMLRDPALQMPAHVPSTTHVPATVAAPPPAFTMMSASRSSPANEIPLAGRGPGSRSRARMPMLVGGGTLAFVALVVLAIVFGPLARRAAPAAATAPPEPAASSVFAPSEPLTTIPLEVPPPAPPLSSVATDVVAPPASSLAPQKKAKSVGTAQSSATPAPAKSDAPPDPYGRRL
jgi:serine/threonine-protein kinase